MSDERKETVRVPRGGLAVESCPGGWTCENVICTPALPPAKLSRICDELKWLSCCEEEKWNRPENAALLRRAQGLVKEAQRVAERGAKNG